MPRSIHSPAPSGQGCIAAKFSSLVALSGSETSLLDALEEKPQSMKAGDLAKSLEKALPPLLVVKSGWLISQHINPQGHRSIVRSHHPGDILGFSDLAYRRSPYQSYAKSDAVVCPLTRRSLSELLARSPRLASIFLAISLIEQSQQDDRACVSGRNYAAGRVALFILQTLGRLRMVHAHSDDRFHCPLTQTDIGDLVGLTNVHVSRTFTRLEEEGHIKRRGAFIQILNADALKRVAGYTDRFGDYDFSWLPRAIIPGAEGSQSEPGTQA